MEKNKLTYTIYKKILGILFLGYYNPTFINKHLIPKKGSIIFCGNHRHLYDQCLPILSTKKMIHYMAKKEYFDNKYISWFFKSSGCISVDRNTKNAKNSIHEAEELLNKGYNIGIFPEGTRNRTKEKLLDFKIGAVKMAYETNSYIQPFVITGDYKFLSNNLKIKFLRPYKVLTNDFNKEIKKLRDKMIKEL